MRKIREQVAGMSVNERQIALFVMERLRDDLANEHFQTADQLRAYITAQMDHIRADNGGAHRLIGGYKQIVVLPSGPEN